MSQFSLSCPHRPSLTEDECTPSEEASSPCSSRPSWTDRASFLGQSSITDAMSTAVTTVMNAPPSEASPPSTLRIAKTVTQFFKGEGKSEWNESLDTYRAFTDTELEDRHNYVQYFFPSPEPSSYNSSAPIVTKDDEIAFLNDKSLRDELMLNLTRMLIFWEFTMTQTEDDKIQFALASSFVEKEAIDVILRHPQHKHHNLLRLTRVTKSLNALGLTQHALAFQHFLIHVLAPVIDAPARTLQFWQEAIPA